MAVAYYTAGRNNCCGGAPSALERSYDECHEAPEYLASLDASEGRLSATRREAEGGRWKLIGDGNTLYRERVRFIHPSLELLSKIWSKI